MRWVNSCRSRNRQSLKSLLHLDERGIFPYQDEFQRLCVLNLSPGNPHYVIQMVTTDHIDMAATSETGNLSRHSPDNTNSPILGWPLGPQALTLDSENP